MYRKSNGMSELEQEFELEMDDYEMDDFEMDDESETDDFEFESDEESEYGDEEFEAEEDGEYEMFEAGDGDYAERFFELSQREFESESEIDEAVNEIFDDMQREYFSFGGFLKNAAKKGFALAKKAGLKLPQVQALKALLGPAANMLKGNWKTLLKTALSAHPAGMAALPALKAIGFESREDMGENREAWDGYVEAARESYEYLVNNATASVNQPMQANRLAANAFQAGLKKIGNNRRRTSGLTVGGKRAKKVRRITIGPGEVLVIRRRRG